MKIFWIFVEPGKIMKAEEPTVRVGAIPSELTGPPPPKTPILRRMPIAYNIDVLIAKNISFKPGILLAI